MVFRCHWETLLQASEDLLWCRVRGREQTGECRASIRVFSGGRIGATLWRANKELETSWAVCIGNPKTLSLAASDCHLLATDRNIPWSNPSPNLEVNKGDGAELSPEWDTQASVMPCV
jgi:hypothetical protein